MSGDEDYDAFYDIDETNLSKIEPEASSHIDYTNHLDEPSALLTSVYGPDQIVYPNSRRLFSTVKIKNRSLLSCKQSNPTNEPDSNNNQLRDDLNCQTRLTAASSSISQVKFQQPNFLVNHAGSVVKQPLIKIHPTPMSNESVLISSKDLLLKNTDGSATQASLDHHQRMTLVKLLHTTMDAT